MYRFWKKINSPEFRESETASLFCQKSNVRLAAALPVRNVPEIDRSGDENLPSASQNIEK
jgi:hypothetical protein